MASSLKLDLIEEFESYVNSHQSRLCKYTKVEVPVLVSLLSAGVIDSQDLALIEAAGINFAKAKKLFDTLVPKVLQLYEIVTCFQNNLQTVPEGVLRTFLNENQERIQEAILASEN